MIRETDNLVKQGFNESSSKPENESIDFLTLFHLKNKQVDNDIYKI